MSESRSAAFFGMADDSSRLLSSQADGRSLRSSLTPRLTKAKTSRVPSAPPRKTVQSSAPSGTVAGKHARAAQTEAYPGQLGARRGASEQLQDGARYIVQAGAAGTVLEGLDAQELEGSAALKQQGLERALKMALRKDCRPRIFRNSADVILRVRRGKTAAFAIDTNVVPVRRATTSAARQQTPQDILQAYAACRGTVIGSLTSPTRMEAAIAEFEPQPLYRQVLGQGTAIPTLKRVLLRARESNPEATEQKVTDDYCRDAYGAP